MIAGLAKRLPLTAIFVFLSIGITTAFAVSAPGQKYLSPGPMSAGHARLNLECSACHVPFLGVPTEKCAACHRRIANETAGGHGDHAGMIGDCVNCHASHKVPYRSDQHIDRAGVDHQRMRFSLKTHRRESCADCHGARFQRFDRAAADRCRNCHLRRPGGQRGWGGSGYAWAAETSPAVARHLRTADQDCLKCHRGLGRVDYEHDGKSNWFKGRHGRADCGRCHRRQKYERVSTGCATCHKQRHGPAYLRGCARCHKVLDWSDAKPEHDGKLTDAHVDLRCRQCHKEKRFAGFNWECASCHEGPHKQSLGSNCAKCHDQSRWKPARFTHSRGLRGAHTALACAKCHKSQNFSRLSSACSSCHGRKHYSDDCAACHGSSRWRPAKINHRAVSSDCAGCHRPPSGHSGGACSRCHSSRGWKPATAAHGNPLGGVHNQFGCGTCHKGGRYSGLSWACTACHGSKHFSADCAACHDGSRWRPARMNHGAVSNDCGSCHSPPRGHYSGGCGQCHTTGGWRPASGSHGIAVGGRHSGLPCKACHGDGRYAGLSWACSTCHRSPHGAGYGGNCAACHNPSSWRTDGFNHGAASGDCSLCHKPPGKHAQGACSSCHPTGGSWRSDFRHPGIEEHSYNSFACEKCHPSSYGSYSCLGCHDSNDPDDD